MHTHRFGIGFMPATTTTAHANQSTTKTTQWMIALACLVIVYVSTALLVPVLVRQMYALVLMIGYGLFFVYHMGQQKHNTFAFAVALVGLFVIALLNLHNAKSDLYVFEILNRIAALLGFAIIILLKPAPLGNTAKHCLSVITYACALLAFYQMITHPYIIPGGIKIEEIRYIGAINGSDVNSLHPSAFTTLVFVLLFAAFIKNRIGWKVVNWGMLLGMLYALYLYQVRTTFVVALVIVAIMATYSIRYKAIYLIVLFLFLSVIFMSALIWFFHFDLNEIKHLGSGRIGAYVERIHIITNRDLSGILFGSGAGTDSYRGDLVWRWQEKSAHNDYLGTIWEFGLIGFCCLVIYFYSALRFSVNPIMIAVICGILISSGVSNAFLFRPNFMFLYGFAAYLYWLANEHTSAPDNHTSVPEQSRLSHRDKAHIRFRNDLQKSVGDYLASKGK